MAKTILVEKDIEEGARALQGLDAAGLKPKAALWLYYPESESYRYVLALPDIDQKGIGPTLRAIYPVLKELSPPVEFPVFGLSVLDAKDELIRGLHKMFRHTHKGRDVNYRLTGAITEGGFVHDAYVYRA